MQSEGGKSKFHSFPIHYLFLFFSQLIVPNGMKRKIFSPRRNWIFLAHIHTTHAHFICFLPIEGPKLDINFLPAKCWNFLPKGGHFEQRTWINSLFNANLHNKKALLPHDNDWGEKGGKNRENDFPVFPYFSFDRAEELWLSLSDREDAVLCSKHVF
jgi:hypothetical protein